MIIDEKRRKKPQSSHFPPSIFSPLLSQRTEDFITLDGFRRGERRREALFLVPPLREEFIFRNWCRRRLSRPFHSHGRANFRPSFLYRRRIMLLGHSLVLLTLAVALLLLHVAVAAAVVVWPGPTRPQQPQPEPRQRRPPPRWRPRPRRR